MISLKDLILTYYSYNFKVLNYFVDLNDDILNECVIFDRCFDDCFDVSKFISDYNLCDVSLYENSVTNNYLSYCDDCFFIFHKDCNITIGIKNLLIEGVS